MKATGMIESPKPVPWLEKTIRVMLLAVLLSSCMPSFSGMLTGSVPGSKVPTATPGVQTANTGTSTATGSSVTGITEIPTDTPYPFPPLEESEMPPGNEELFPEGTEPSLFDEGTGTVEGTVLEATTTNVVHILAVPTGQPVTPAPVEPHTPAPGLGLPVVLIALLLGIFMSLRKEEQKPGK
jgi:hypothetical protein